MFILGDIFFKVELPFSSSQCGQCRCYWRVADNVDRFKVRPVDTARTVYVLSTLRLAHFTYVRVHYWSYLLYKKLSCNSTKDRLTATRGRHSLYFTMGRPCPSRLPFPMGESGPPSNASFLGPIRVHNQRASRSVRPFLQGWQLWQQSDRPRYSVCNSRRHLRMLQPYNNIVSVFWCCCHEHSHCENASGSFDDWTPSPKLLMPRVGPAAVSKWVSV